MVDTQEVIIRKYQQNLRGLFKLIKRSLEDARQRGYEVLPVELFDLAENIILNRKPEDNMLKLAVKMTNSDLMNNISTKNVDYFVHSWKSFVDVDLNPKIVEIADRAFKVYDSNGNIAIQHDDINKIFDFFSSLFKVSAKMALCLSGVKSMRKDGDFVHYELVNQIHPSLDGVTLSNLINKYNIVGVPTP